MKKTSVVTLRLTDEARAELGEAARAQGVSVSEFIRRQAQAFRSALSVSSAPGAPAPGHVAKADTGARQHSVEPQPAPSLQTYRVDDLGPDPLRDDNGALSR